jgi:hypothetical protein
VLAVCCLALGDAAAAPKPNPHRLGGDWVRFGYDAARHNAGPKNTGITRQNVGRLKRLRVVLDGTVDSSPIYLRRARIGGRMHDTFVVTTTYGKVIALDANSGRVLWQFVPPGYATWAGTYQITTSSPVADPTRLYVFSAAPDGRIYKLLVSTGAPVRSGGWPVAITLLPAYEKISSPLNIAGNYVLATTASFGDMWTYQGHVAVIDRRSGRLVRVWNALCSRIRVLLNPLSCELPGAGIWARSGVVVQPGTRNLIVATGNGVWNPPTHWSTSVVMLSPDGSRVLQSWTPHNQQELAEQDLDLSSTAPALLTKRLAVQGGKDGQLRLLDLRDLDGRSQMGIARTGGELQTLLAPNGSGVFSTPAVWQDGATPWLFVANNAGVAGYTVAGNRIVRRWERLRDGGPLGTSPVIAGGLLYVYNTSQGMLDVHLPRSGALVASLAANPGHWNSPIVTDGRIALGEGDANLWQTTGVLNIYFVP